MINRARRILIVGVASFWGRELAKRLERDQSVEYVAGIDTKPPRGDFDRTEFLEADIRSPVINKLIPSTKADTVIHAGIVGCSDGGISERVAHEANVAGALQLLSACEKTAELRTLVVKGSAAIYGCEATAPSFLTEDMVRVYGLRTKRQRDIAELESYFENFGRRHSQVTCTVLRFQPAIGIDIHTPLTSYLTRPIVPTQLGYDPRLQFLHHEDGLSAIEHAARNPFRGVVNIAGEGAISLTRLLRRAGKITVPILPPLFRPLLASVGRLGIASPNAELSMLLRYGRVVDTKRMQQLLGFTPRYSTESAVQDFLIKSGSRQLLGNLREAVVGRA